VIERAAILGQNGRLRIDAPFDQAEVASPMLLRGKSESRLGVITEDAIRAFERENIVAALKALAGKIFEPCGAAELLNMKSPSLQESNRFVFRREAVNKRRISKEKPQVIVSFTFTPVRTLTHALSCVASIAPLEVYANPRRYFVGEERIVVPFARLVGSACTKMLHWRSRLDAQQNLACPDAVGISARHNACFWILRSGIFGGGHGEARMAAVFRSVSSQMSPSLIRMFRWRLGAKLPVKRALETGSRCRLPVPARDKIMATAPIVLEVYDPTFVSLMLSGTEGAI
jgi:hypothetical protein